MRILLAAWLVSAAPMLTPQQLTHRLVAQPPPPTGLPADFLMWGAERDDGRFDGVVLRHLVGSVDVKFVRSENPPTPRSANFADVHYFVYLTADDALGAFDRRDRQRDHELGTVRGLPHSVVTTDRGSPSGNIEAQAVVDNVVVESSVLGERRDKWTKLIAIQVLRGAVSYVQKLQR